jgi:hypothetical protein
VKVIHALISIRALVLNDRPTRRACRTRWSSKPWTSPAAQVGPDRYCLPRHKMPLIITQEMSVQSACR